TPAAALARGFPDRIARRRAEGEARYLLSGGGGARLDPAEPLARAALLVAVELDGTPRGPDARIRRAIALERDELAAALGARIEERRLCTWSARERRVRARIEQRLGALVLGAVPWPDPPAEACAAALIEGIRALGLGALPGADRLQALLARCRWLAAEGVEIPAPDEAALLEALPEWLGSWLAGRRRLEEIDPATPAAAFEAWLGLDRTALLRQLAPATIRSPLGRRLRIDYGAGRPELRVRVQELFGLDRHPCVGPRATPVVLVLLSPAGRPIQITTDLPGFWRGSWAEVRREMRARYPKHPWPEDPLAASPTLSARSRRR
ncbi:MAG: ATP-dependent helicase HrpB, partial [Alphaproteobacteria bacterium]